MSDARKNEPVRVRNEGGGPPYLQFSEVQLDAIRHLLDGHGISYWLDPVSISFNGEPHTMYIRFGRKGDALAIQAILDSVR